MINVVVLVGRLTKDPEFQKIVSTGNSLAKFTLANNQWSKDGDKVSFVSCIAFGRTADNIYNHVHKGDLIGVVGKINTSQYTAKDGSKRVSTDVIVNEAQFLERRQKEEAPKTDEFGGLGLDVDPEDLPF